jgi:glutathione S-transferase
VEGPVCILTTIDILIDGWLVRYVLNYKRLEYETRFVSYPDIKALWQELALSPLGDSAQSGPTATLPVISVPSKDGKGPPTVIADSLNIALYLDHEYPDTPSVIPPNTAALQASFCALLPSLLSPNLRPLLMPSTIQRLDDRGSQYFVKMRLDWYGFDVNKLPDRDTSLGKLQQAFSSLHEILNTNRGELPADASPVWVMGSVGPTFADFALGSFLSWIKLMGDDDLWTALASWNAGRWVKHYEALGPYQQTE